MRLHVLGSGCPAPSKDQFGSAFILKMGAEFIMVDCGPATTYKMALMGLAPGLVEHLFLTHHHFDHNVDVPCFLLTRWDQDNGTYPPLKIYGPSSTEKFVERLIGNQGAFFADWKSRVVHPASEECHKQRGGSLPRPPPTVRVKDMGSGSTIKTPAWTVTARRVHHVEPTLESLVYRFDTDEGSILFAGDCGDCPELRDMARGVDTLVIACTHFGPAEAGAAVADVITGTPEVAEIGRVAEVKRVVLTHVSPSFSRVGVKERAIAEIARAYSGDIFFPSELTTIEIPK